MLKLNRFSSQRIFGLIVLAVGSQAALATTYWQENPATPDDWFDNFAWSAGIPISNSNSAYIGNGGTATITYGDASAEGLYLGYGGGTNNNSSSGTVAMTGGQLNCGNYLYVGYSQNTTGLFTQSGGQVVASTLYLGAYNSAGNGVYQLSGTGQLNTSNESIGSFGTNSGGTGQFIQTGGTHTISDELQIYTGSYSMSGNSTLTMEELDMAANTGNIATFTQVGGSVALTNSFSYIGYNGQASYSMSAGATLTTSQSGSFYVGDYGSGSFSQTDSTCNFGTGTLYLGAYGNGTTDSYTLAGNSQLSSGNQYIGNGFGVHATFIQTGGTNNLGTQTLYLGYNGATATYTMSGNSFLFSGNQYLGDGSPGAGIFLQGGGTNDLGTYNLYIGYGGATASYQMQGNAMLMAANEYVSSNVSAVFTQSGGDNIISNSSSNGGVLNVGTGANGSGNAQYLLSSGALSATTENIGYTGSPSSFAALFTQAGGNNTAGTLSVNVSAQYLLQSGMLTATTENIGYSSGSTGSTTLFNQTGGNNTVGAFTIAATGRYNLLAGTFQVTKSFANSGTFDLQNPAAAGIAGTNTVTLAGIPITGAGSIIVEPNAALYTGTITQGALTIGGKIQIAPGSAPSKITSLDIIAGGSLDIANNALVIDYGFGNPSPLSAVRAYLRSGYTNGWTGSGVISSIAAGDLAVGVGYAEASDLNDPNLGTGFVLDSSSVLIRYTWMGDANLDGIVNAEDFNMIHTNGSTWDTGDFNYDGVVNADDYSLFDLGSAEGGSTTIPVPEPAAMIFLIASLAAFSSRRRTTTKSSGNSKQ